MFCIPLMCDGRPVYTLNMRCTARRPYCGTGLHYHYTHVPPRSNYPTRQRKCQPPNVYQCDEVMEINSRPPSSHPQHIFFARCFVLLSVSLHGALAFSAFLVSLSLSFPASLSLHLQLFVLQIPGEAVGCLVKFDP